MGYRNHDVKCDVQHFQPIVDGLKKADIRINDRDYRLFDTVTFHEGQYEDGDFVRTGRSIKARICHLSHYGCVGGYLCLSLDQVGLVVESGSTPMDLFSKD